MHAEEAESMDPLTYLLAFLLSSSGLTILFLWPEGGPSGWSRERVLRRILPASARGVLDCYVCFGFWTGLLLSPLWWWWTGFHWCWAGCLMTPTIFWFALKGAR